MRFVSAFQCQVQRVLTAKFLLVASEEYQSLHPDAIWGILDGHVADQKLPPAVTVPQFTLALRHEPYCDLLGIARGFQVIISLIKIYILSFVYDYMCVLL